MLYNKVMPILHVSLRIISPLIYTHFYYVTLIRDLHTCNYLK